MDTRAYYGGSGFLKVEDVPSPRVVTIVAAAEGKFGKIDLTFDDGSKLGVNATNGRILAKAWGFESDDWIGTRAELYVGTVPFNGEPQESILLKPIKSGTPANDRVVVPRNAIGSTTTFRFDLLMRA